MTDAIIIGLVGGSITVAGWFFLHDQNRQLQLRKDRLELLNRQLSDFYGPLYVSCVASKIAYRRLLDKLKRIESIEEREPSIGELEEWMDWMKAVFLPLNQHREEIIQKHSHLIIEDAVPDCIVEFMAHVATYRVIATKWDAQQGVRDKFAHIEFPHELDDYAKASFSALKREQTDLIGQLRATSLLARQGPVRAVKAFFERLG